MNKHSRSGWWVAVAVSGLLAACGGGGSDGPPPPTAIPESLSITAPGTSESATAVRFSNSAGALTGLKYSWDFGDGGASTDAAPSHSFANGGEFEVVLKVTNEVGASREVRSKVTITNIANVRGLVCTGADSAGWCWQAPRPTGNRVNSVFFLNATLGWRAGDNGEIFKTADGGATWVKQSSGISSSIQGIAFLDEQIGWATGAFGAVLKTINGGSTWSVDKISEAASSSYDPGVITPIDANTVYLGRPVGGTYGAMFSSSDAGGSWRILTPTPSVVTKNGKLWALQGHVVNRSVDAGKTFNAVLELKPDGGYSYFDSITLAARDDQKAAVLTGHSRYDYTQQKYVYQYTASTTLNGGASWQRVEANGLASYGTYLRLLSVSEDGKVLNAMGGSNALLRSVDGGQNWAPLGSIDSSWYTPSVYVLDADMFYAVGYGGLYLSENGGLAWSKLTLPKGVETYYLSANALRRVDAQTLLLTDSAGNAYLSKDKGATWVLVASNSTSYWAPAVAFRDAKNGFMVDDKGRSFATRDGGATWQVKREDFGTVQSLQFVSKQVGWLIGSDGRLYKSTDGGDTWLTSPVTQGTYYTTLKFETETLGWARRSGFSSGSAIMATEDGGQTWRDLNLSLNMLALRMSPEAWVAVGYYGEVLQSKDKGATWKSVYTGTNASLNAVAFSDAKTAWVVGTDGVLLKSVDAGATWTLSQPAGASGLRDIKFANAKVGWIVGNGGLILSTVDGGKTWRTQASGTTVSLAGIQIADANTAWITGEGGVLLATGNGGN